MSTLRTTLRRKSVVARANRSFTRALDRAVTPASRDELLYLQATRR